MLCRNKPHYERWFYRVLYTANFFEIVSRIYRLLGRRFYVGVCQIVAWWYAVTQRGVRNVVRDNLRLLVPRRVKASEAVQTFVNYGATIADYVAIGAMPKQEALSLCVFAKGREHIEEAAASGRGVILATGHYGFFEYGALILGHMGYPVSVVTFPEPSRELTEWRAAYRARWGAETLEIGTDPFSSIPVIQALRNGRFTAMLADRPMGSRSIPISLPGGRIPFSVSPAMLAWITNCDILPVVVRRTPQEQYEIIAKPAVRPDRAKPRDEAIDLCTSQGAAALFEEITQDPTGTNWYHCVGS